MSDPEHPVQAGIVNLGKDAGPHMLALTDDKRLVVSDYFPSTKTASAGSTSKEITTFA